MAQLSDLKLAYRLFMEAYPYRRVDWRPGTRLDKPLTEARIAVVTTAGYYLPGQAPFDHSIRGGDCGFRVIPAGADPRSLLMGHKSDAFDASGIQADSNLALPLDRLRELATGGVFGEVAPEHFSFMGSITAPGALMRETAPAAAEQLRSAKVDGVLLTPV
jgi:D-proline reductase (dithiol) PrdB